ncbi:MAG: LysE family translocator [Paracoccaceae bacterium]
MTVTLAQLSLYTTALLVLFLTPGPVWVALSARAISGGFPSAWPLALGVVVGDVLWPLLAIFGVGFIVSVYADFLILLRYVAVIMFFGMGILLIRHAGRSLSDDPRLTRPGRWAGFAAGLLVIAGNPKAILFYMGILPGFFELAGITIYDIAAICLLSAFVPMAGNLVLALFVGRIRRFLSSPRALRRTNIGAGVALIGVGLAIALL